MATPLSTKALLAALKAEGVRYVEHRGWTTHNRNNVGAWGPVNGVMMHHTGPYTNEPQMIELCWTGYSGLPGPLCHGVIDRSGTVHLVGHGRANHAGKGDGDVLRAVIAETKIPTDDEADTDGNARFYGFEAINRGDGKQEWPAAQIDAMVRVSAAICRAHGWTAPSVIAHKEWQPGKPDPAGVSMDEFRAKVAERLKHTASWSPTKPGTKPAPKTLEQRVTALEQAVDKLQGG